MMSILGHLEELRRRLIQVVIAVLGAAVIGFIFSGAVLDILRAPLPDAYENLYFTNPADAFSAQLKIAGFLGIAMAMPVILFHAWRFVTPGLEPLLTVDGYIGFVTTMMLAFGLVLEFPIVLIGLARVGVLNYRRLASQRRWAILAIVLFAIVLTPGGDPISPLILSGVMFLLFEGSLLVIRLIRR